MIARGEGPGQTLRELAGRPVARAALVLVVLWLGTAVLLRGDTEFGGMIAILACASAVLWGPGAGWRYAFGQLVLWAALLVATAWLLWETPHLPGMGILFGVAAAWFILAEPILRARRAP
jgi:hypothetical protein